MPGDDQPDPASSLDDTVIRDRMRCLRCQGPVQFDGRWDSYVCLSCDWYTEEKCSDPDCPYCPTRPDRPSDDQSVP